MTLDLAVVDAAPFTPTRDDMEEEYLGVLVSSFDPDGDEGAIALTGDKALALDALDSYFREVCAQPNLLDDASRPLTDAYFYLDSGHAVFTRRPDGGWNVTPAPYTARYAIPVTWFSTPMPLLEGSPNTPQDSPW